MRKVYKIIFAGSLIPVSVTGNSKDADSCPNIVIILADDLGYGDLSCMGATDIHSPNIDSLFSSGMKLTSCYANSNVSSPSRAALLSGCYPDLVGVQGVIRSTVPYSSWGYLSPDSRLLPEFLKDIGYDTAMIGKWNLGSESPNLPNERGFDYYKGFLDDMMDSYYHHRRHGINFMRENTKVIDPEGHATDLFTEWAIDYITKRKDSPFFLYLAYNAPHTPLQPPIEWENAVLKRENGISSKRSKLVALIEHLDYNVGLVLDAIHDNGLDENTIIIFTSDNGGDKSAEATCGKHRGYKGEMYDGGLLVPFVVCWKGHIGQGVSDNFVTLADIYPTLCDFLGYDSAGTFDGLSLMPLFEGNDMETDDRYVIWRRREYQFGGKSQFAIRYKNYKLLQSDPFSGCELYDLQKDPMETKPLPDTMQIYMDLLKNLARHYMKAGRIPYQK